MTLAQTFLSSAEQEAVRQTVQAVEKTTSGEIAPMVVSASHEYPAAAIVGGLTLAVVPALMMTMTVDYFLWTDWNSLWIFLLMAALFFPVSSFLIERSLRMKRWFVSESQMALEVQRGAFLSFYQENLHQTREENGVLLYISVFERKAWILGDRGVNGKIAASGWQPLVDNLTQGIRQRKRGEAICHAIEEIGNLLREHFPVKVQDANELEDLIIGKSQRAGHDLVIR